MHVDALRNIVDKTDVLVVLPTGYEKSLVFQLLPFVFDSWMEVSDSIILVVSPLNAAGSVNQTSVYETRENFCREAIVY